MKLYHEIKLYRIFKSYFLCLIFLYHFISSQTTDYETTIYIKTDGNFKEMEHYDRNNNVKREYSEDQLNFKDSLYIAKIENSFYCDEIKIKFERESGDTFHIGFLVKIEDMFYEIQDKELTVETDQTNSLNCTQETTFIKINQTYSKEVKYCISINYFSMITIYVKIPFNIYQNCYESCAKCSNFGDETNHNCIECKTNDGYYFKEDDVNNNCYTKNEIEENYYLDNSINNQKIECLDTNNNENIIIYIQIIIIVNLKMKKNMDKITFLDSIQTS